MKLFVTGIGTDVGKTVVSAILTEVFQADYWKPIQSGDLDNTDSDKVKNLVSNSVSVFHPSSYSLRTAASPHFAAELDNVKIDIKKIKEPKTKNHLIIEGAGGIYVPLNSKHTILDLIQPDYKVILVSKHYLGSINHTLMTLDILKNKGLNVCGVIFSGDENSASEKIIVEKTGVSMLGRVDQEPYFDRNVIRYYADRFENILSCLLE